MIGLAVLFVLGFFLVYLQWSKDRAVNSLLAEQAAERLAWAQERRELNTHIQHPEIVLPLTTEEPRPDEDFLTSQPDEIDLVGTVQTGTTDG